MQNEINRYFMCRVEYSYPNTLSRKDLSFNEILILTKPPPF